MALEVYPSVPRFQGQRSHRFADHRVLATEFVKERNGWRVVSARLA